MDLNEGLNIIVGDNEAGKSTILEAINLALTKRLNGRPVEYEITPYMFNTTCVKQYLALLKSGKNPPLPELIIELYLQETADIASYTGSMNVQRENCCGIKIEIVFDEDNRPEYCELVKDPSKIQAIPVEFYKVQWYTFAHGEVNYRRLPVRVSYIDATTIRLQSGADYYLQDIIRTELDSKERAGLNIAYRHLKEEFSKQGAIGEINAQLKNKKGAITNKKLAISIDISQRSNWETTLTPHLDDLPFQLIGKGEQNALKIMLALDRKADEANVILIEEPENHLSFSSMNTLVSKIKEKCGKKQILITTHSAYVLNKLGLENLVLLHNEKTTTLKNLSPDTQDYFKKLSGYDTLRVVLAKKSILVEGPSDELVVQKAYVVKKGKLPIEDGVDVVNVRGLSFSRFLDISKELGTATVVVTDNDGDYENKVDAKYVDYEKYKNILICRSDNNSLKTLEPQLASVNTLEKMNGVLGKQFTDKTSLVEYMTANKTEAGLKMFETRESINFPQYIHDAIA